MAAEDDELTHLWPRNNKRSKLGQLGGLIKYIIHILMGRIEKKISSEQIWMLMYEGSMKLSAKIILIGQKILDFGGNLVCVCVSEMSAMPSDKTHLS